MKIIDAMGSEFIVELPALIKNANHDLDRFETQILVGAYKEPNTPVYVDLNYLGYEAKLGNPRLLFRILDITTEEEDLLYTWQEAYRKYTSELWEKTLSLKNTLQRKMWDARKERVNTRSLIRQELPGLNEEELLNVLDYIRSLKK